MEEDTDKSTKGTSIEVGPNHFPLIEVLRDDLVKDGDSIVFVDRIHSVVKDLKNDLDDKSDVWGISGRFKNAQTVQSDAGNLPVRDNSTNLIFASNFVTSPGQAYSRPIGESGFDKPNVPDLDTLADNWSSKLRNGGKIVLFETYTPTAVKKENIISAFENRGLKLTEEYSGDNVRKIFMNHPFSNNAVRDRTPGSFALVLEKQY